MTFRRAGCRFVLTDLVEAESGRPPTIRVGMNWHEEFRDREQDYGMQP